MARVTVRPATAADVDYVIRNARAPDRAEAAALAPLPFADMVKDTVALSQGAMAGTFDDMVVCIFGVIPYSPISSRAMPWMIGTEDLYSAGIPFARRAGVYLAEMRHRYPYLENWVHAENRKAVAWLKSLGFVVHDAAPHGWCGSLFHRFEMRPD